MCYFDTWTYKDIYPVQASRSFQSPVRHYRPLTLCRVRPASPGNLKTVPNQDVETRLFYLKSPQLIIIYYIQRLTEVRPANGKNAGRFLLPRSLAFTGIRQLTFAFLKNAPVNIPRTCSISRRLPAPSTSTTHGRTGRTSRAGGGHSQEAAPPAIVLRAVPQAQDQVRPRASMQPLQQVPGGRNVHVCARAHPQSPKKAGAAGTTVRAGPGYQDGASTAATSRRRHDDNAL